MVSTINCYITSPKSQNDLDNRVCFLAGVVTAAPAYFLLKVQITPEPWRWTARARW